MSARQQLSIRKWGRTVSFLDGEAGIQYPADSLNAKLHGLTYKPRDGYNEVAISPMTLGQPYSLLGLGHVTNGTGVSEFISVEDRNGTIKAYSINDSLLTRSVTSLGPDTLLNGGDWVITNFDENAYLINPGATKTVYRHKIGDPTSLAVVEDIAYVGSSDAQLTITPNSFNTRGWDAGDTWTYTSLDGILPGATFTTASGVVTVVAADNDNGKIHQTQFQSVLASTQDWTDLDYVAVHVISLNPGDGTVRAGHGHDIFNSFSRTNIAPEIKTNGVWRVLASTDFKEYIDVDRSSVTIAICTKNVPDLNLVQGIKFNVGGSVNRFGSPNACTINPLILGGTYLESKLAGHRLWDGTLDGDGITYGVRYKKAGPLYSPLSQATITAGEGHGFKPTTYSLPIGGRIALSTPIATLGGYTDVEFVRLMADGTTWKILTTVANTGAPQFQDKYEENELAALTTATGISVDPIIPTPPFSTKGVRFAFPFKQSMIWLTSGGIGNIHISRVGVPEEIYDSEVTYNQDDLTQPAQRTLADNQADQPVWGVQAGANAFIVGEKAAFALQGDFPVTLSPSRQIPGSRGIVGPYAGCRFRPIGGQDGAAYLDNECNVWLVNSAPEFTGDTRAKPYELSSLVRHKIKQFLLTEQLGEFPALSMTQALLEFQEATSSLWVILGKRAAVYRQDDSGPGWEFYEYQLTTPPGSESVSLCRAYSPGSGTPTSVVRTGWTKDWNDPAYGAVDDDNEATSGLYNYGDKSKLLRSAGIPPAVLLPLSATLDKIKIRSRHRKEGEIDVFHDWTKLTLDGVPTGSNLALNEVVGTAQTTIDYEITTGLPSIADINDGKVGFETAYVAAPGNPAWNDPANYNIVVTKVVPTPNPLVTTQNSTASIDVTYTGPGAPPPNVDLDVTASAWVSAALWAVPVDEHYSVYLGEGTITDGLGNTASGSMIATEVPNSGRVTINNSKIINVPLTAGHGVYGLTSTGTVVNSSSSLGIWVDYDVTAAFHPKVLSNVFVDSMEISYCFTVVASSEGADSGISWERVCFTPDSKYLAGRSSGQLDLVEYDFRNDSFIGGNGRDGGYEMPDWQLTLERLTFEGRTARLSGVQVNTLDPTDAFDVSGRIGNSAFVPATHTGTTSSRWVRFPATQIGISHQVKIAGDETVDGIDGLAIEYQMTSRSKVN